MSDDKLERLRNAFNSIERYVPPASQRERRKSDNGTQLELRTDIKHGTNSGYNAHRCRCDKCRAWKSETGKRTREKAFAEGRFEHGTIHGYRVGCRCDECRTARRESSRRRRQR